MPSNRSLLVRLLAPYLFVLVAVAGSLYAYGARVVEQLYLDTLSDQLLNQARLVGELLPWDQRGPAMDRHCAAVAGPIGVRVTVIAPDGSVLGDSEAPSASLENHADRPEVRAALSDESGRSVRTSASVHHPLFYRAWRQTRGDAQRIVRLAVPIATIDEARHRIEVAIWGGVAVAALAALWPALVLSRRLSRRVTRLADFANAVADGREPPPLAPESHDVVTGLETNVLAMANSLSTQLTTARQEQGKFEAVLRSMVEGVVVIDRDAAVRLANRCADQLFGLEPYETMVGTPLIAISRDPDLHAVVREVMSDDSEPPVIREMTLQEVSLQVTATPIANNGEEPDLFILVFHNITVLKKLETTRRDFVANVSHELRTPLTAIRGYAETLQSGAIDDPELARKFVGVIERHSERLSRLTDDLLTLSDLELGRAELQRVALALDHSVDAAIDVVRDKAAQGQVEIRREIGADLPALYADPDRIEQVLVNLIDNAVKFTPPGGSVTVSARLEAPPSAPESNGAWVDIEVADTGIGVPSQDLPRLTERFYRVDKARSRELGGTGLGLAIVKHIVQAHGGMLRIESEVGRGTRVHVHLPVAARSTPSSSGRGLG